MIKLSLFGTPQLTVNAEPKQIRTQKAFALFIYLVITREVHSRATLASLFWPAVDRARANGSLRYALRVIRAAVGEDALDITRQTVRATALVMPDVEAFRSLIEKDTVGALEAAQALYKAPFLEDFTLPDCPRFDDWQLFTARELAQLHIQALQKLIETHSKAQNWAPVITYAQKWVAYDPLCEPAYRQLMWAYAQQGQQSDALNQYARCREMLSNELGLDPSPETKALYLKVGSGDFLNKTPQTTPPADAPRHNLPSAVSALIGRTAEIETLKTTIPDQRLVTILGQGGIGKTRLAIEVAHQLRPHFMAGVWVVQLAPLKSAADIALQIAKTAQISPGTDPVQALITHWQDQQVLLVLDNFEHLLADGAVQQLKQLLEALPQLHVLATSRESLQIAGEFKFFLQGLDVASDALKLFVERSRLVQPALTNIAALPAIRRICELTNGLPLAIEMAAAWRMMLSCEQIVAEIERGLAVLVSNNRDSDPRHRSMTVVFDYSWNLLAAVEQQTLCELATFHGGFTREAAEAVTSATLLTLYQLVNKSLLGVTAERYDWHPLFHQYITAKCAGSSADRAKLTQQHATYFANFLQANHPEHATGRQGEVLDAIDADFANVKQAWQWAIAEKSEPFLQMAVQPVYQYLSIRHSTREGIPLFQQALEMIKTLDASDISLLLLLHVRLAGLYHNQLQLEPAKQLLLQAIPFCEQFPQLVETQMVYHELGLITYTQAQYEQASKYLALAVKHEDLLPATAVAHILTIAGAVQRKIEKPETAQTFYRRSLEIYEAEQYEWGIAIVTGLLGVTAVDLADLSQAEAYFDKSIKVARKIGSDSTVVQSLIGFGRLAHLQEDVIAAQAYFEKALVICKKSNLVIEQLNTYQGLGRFQLATNPSAALLSLKSALAIAVQSGLTARSLDIVVDLADAFLQLQDPDRAQQLLLQVQGHRAIEIGTQKKLTALASQLFLPAPSAAQENSKGLGEEVLRLLA